MDPEKVVWTVYDVIVLSITTGEIVVEVTAHAAAGVAGPVLELQVPSAFRPRKFERIISLPKLHEDISR